MLDLGILESLAVALSAGLIVGAERGWDARDVPEGERVAGIRTFALIGLAGGLAAILNMQSAEWIAGAIALGMAGLLIAARLQAADEPDIGATTEVASIVTFGLGAVAGLGHAVPAIAGAVTTALLLGAKPALHRWLRTIDQRELFAALQFILISAVILPLLPDEQLGPFAALNPYRLWWIVVIVAGVSFAGYLATKLLGSRSGIMLTGLAGGLVASTATAVALLRRGRDLSPDLYGSLTAGVTAANGVMTLRLLVLALLIHPPLGVDLILPLGAMALSAMAVAAWLWLVNPRSGAETLSARSQNPLHLWAGVLFALLLGAVTLLTEFGRVTFGSFGVYTIVVLSSLVDVDAISVSLANQAAHQLEIEIARTGIFVAASINTSIKIVLGYVLGPRSVAHRIALTHAAIIAAGMLAIVAR